MKILNKEVIQLLKDFREKIKDAMRMHPQFTEFKNLYAVLSEPISNSLIGLPSTLDNLRMLLAESHTTTLPL